MQVGGVEAGLKNKNSLPTRYSAFELAQQLVTGPFIRDARYRGRNLFGRKMNRVYHGGGVA